MVNPKEWGADGWYFMHSLSQNFKPEELEKYKKIFRALRWVLPCKVCREGYAQDLKKHRLNQIKDARSLSRWVLKMQNETNRKIGAKTISEYNLPNKYRHGRVINFLRIAMQDAVRSDNKKALEELQRIRRLLVFVIPCSKCRYRMRNNDVPHFKKLFNVMQRSHQ